MGVATHQPEAVLPGKRRDPDIVLRNRRALGPEDGLKFAVRDRRRRVTGQHRGSRRKRGQPIKVRGRACRLAGAVVQFAQRDDRDEDGLGLLDAAADAMARRSRTGEYLVHRVGYQSARRIEDKREVKAPRHYAVLISIGHHRSDRTGSRIQRTVLDSQRVENSHYPSVMSADGHGAADAFVDVLHPNLRPTAARTKQQGECEGRHRSD